MNSFILRQAAQVLFPALLLLSVIELYRGHNLPGGGFIGGLLAASAFILVGLGDSMETARRKLRISPATLLAVGLAVSLLSGFPALFTGGEFMEGRWFPAFKLPLMGTVHLGTPLLFDLGVFFVVIGFTLGTVFSLARLAEENE